MATRRHGARRHWPADAVVYVGGSEAFLDAVGAADGEFAWLWSDATGSSVDMSGAPSNAVLDGAAYVMEGAAYVVHGA